MNVGIWSNQLLFLLDLIPYLQFYIQYFSK